jgi:DNA-directed RNA polymerase specialized sigma24 family protein
MVSEKVSGVYTSRLILDAEMATEFNGFAILYSNFLREKYYSVSELYPPEDIANEIWCKVLRNDIDWDREKSRTLSGFVYMLVEHMYIDLGRNKNHKLKLEPLPKDMFEGGRNIEDIWVDKVNMEEAVVDSIILREFIDSLDNKVREEGSYSVREVVSLKLRGLKTCDIAKHLGVDGRSVSRFLKGHTSYLKKVYKSLNNSVKK